MVFLNDSLVTNVRIESVLCEMKSGMKSIIEYLNYCIIFYASCRDSSRGKYVLLLPLHQCIGSSVSPTKVFTLFLQCGQIQSFLPLYLIGLTVVSTTFRVGLLNEGSSMTIRFVELDWTCGSGALKQLGHRRGFLPRDCSLCHEHSHSSQTKLSFGIKCSLL